MALSDGLVGYWSPWLGSSGYRLLDRTGRGNHGTLTNMDAGTDWVGATVQGRSGFSLDYDGTNDTVIVPDQTGVNVTTNAITLAAWIYPANVTSYKQIFAKASGTGSTQRQYGLYITGAGGPGLANSLGFEIRTSATVEQGFGTVITLQWNHVAGTYNGSIMAWYINGIQVGTANQSGNIVTQSSSLYLGQFSSGGFSTFNGRISDWSIHNRGLTQSEILNLYRLGPGWYRPYAKRSIGYQLAGFKAYWHRRQSQVIGGGLR